MRRLTIPMPLLAALVAGCAAGCATRPPKTAGTLAELRNARPDVQEMKVEQGLEQAMEHYRRFLEDTPETTLTPEAIRRLADLQIEKQFGIRAGDTRPREMAAPEPANPLTATEAGGTNAGVIAGTSSRESDQDFERRTTAEAEILPNSNTIAPPLIADPTGPLEAIALYDRLLKEYPSYEHKDQVLYQMARAYDELGFLQYAFVETVVAMQPFYVIRALGGVLFLVGSLIMVYNLWRTARGDERVEARPVALALRPAE